MRSIEYGVQFLLFRLNELVNLGVGSPSFECTLVILPTNLEIVRILLS